MVPASMSIDPGSNARGVPAAIGNTMPLRKRVVTAPAFRHVDAVSTRVRRACEILPSRNTGTVRAAHSTL
jgi:hypothetical protein